MGRNNHNRILKLKEIMKEFKFRIYKYLISETGERDLLYADDGVKPIDKAQKLFGEMLDDADFGIAIAKKDGEVTKYEHLKLRKYNNVFLLNVCNIRRLKYIQKYEEHFVESNPWCNVIIDNRDGIAHIAVEKSPAFDDTDEVCRLLAHGMNNYLSRYGLQVEIRSMSREVHFWDVVEEYIRHGTDRVTGLKFEFDAQQKRTPITASDEMKSRLEFMADIARMTQASKGFFSLGSDTDKGLVLNREQEDIAQMVKLCCNNGYTIAVRFATRGIFRYGEKESMTEYLDESKLEEFKNGQQTIFDGINGGLSLIGWLDKLIETTKGYKYDVPVDKKRKAKSKDADKRQSSF